MKICESRLINGLNELTKEFSIPKLLPVQFCPSCIHSPEYVEHLSVRCIRRENVNRYLVGKNGLPDIFREFRKR